MLNVIAAVFNHESEGYQAITALRNEPVLQGTAIMEMALVKNEDHTVKVCDGYRDGALTIKDASVGSLIGGLVGVIGGPIGVLLGGAVGAGTGGMKDMADAAAGQSLIENVAGKMYADTMSLIILAEEENEEQLDKQLEQYDVEVLRFDAAVVAAEIEEARELQIEMQRQAKLRMREDKKEEYKEKALEKIEQLSSEASQIIEKYEK